MIRCFGRFYDTMSNDKSHVNDEFKLITYKRGKNSSKYKILPKTSTISVPSSTQINKETALRLVNFVYMCSRPNLTF
jgi:hypothetical protein